jgi:hypothetical protein
MFNVKASTFLKHNPPAEAAVPALKFMFEENRKEKLRNIFDMLANHGMTIVDGQLVEMWADDESED